MSLKSAPVHTYVFWHWKQPGIDVVRYESTLREFHRALGASPPEGFVHSVSAALAGAGWANDGREAYIDRYFIRSSAALDTLDAAIAGVARHAAHESIAGLAAGGVGGLSTMRLGTPLRAPRHAYWFSKPRNVTYSALLQVFEPIVRRQPCALWMRRLVLGPGPEFCLESMAPVDCPEFLTNPPIELRTLGLIP
jgi:hypothetical protein